MRRALVVGTALVALAAAGCGQPDPNEVCQGHDGVAKVNMTGYAVNGVVCRDGHFEGGDG